jgi:hypothetical protein
MRFVKRILIGLSVLLVAVAIGLAPGNRCSPRASRRRPRALTT